MTRNRVPVGVYAATRTIRFFGTPSCDTSMEHENKGKVEHTTLSFSTLNELPTDAPLAFVVTTVSGKNFLIGVQEWPFPIVKIKSTTGKLNGEAATHKVTVTFSAEKSLIPCASFCANCVFFDFYNKTTLSQYSS